MKQFVLTSTNPAFNMSWFDVRFGYAESNNLCELLRIAKKFADNEDGRYEHVYCFINNDARRKPHVMLSRSMFVTPMSWDALFDSNEPDKLRPRAVLFFCDMLDCTADEIEFPRRDEE